MVILGPLCQRLLLREAAPAAGDVRDQPALAYKPTANRLAATGDPVADTVAACAAAVKASIQMMVDAKAQPVADVEHAFRGSLMGLRPAFEKRWRWQRWASLIGASAAGCVAMVLVAVGAWTLSAAIARHDANAEVARWQAWWTATCADQSPRRVVLAGKPVCQVPMEQAGGK
jgi:hypothetical protein